MKIDVAGAGAGKTTGLAKEIIAKHKITPNNKNIYCVAFTNAAVASIREKIQSHFGMIPSNIIICTIHSFLYQEFIFPYYYLLYKKHYKFISTIQLPMVQSYKNARLSELENKDILHVEKIPERAKWVVVKKSSDKAREQRVRDSILSAYLSYCGSIYVDEAQDIDSNMKEIFSKLDILGVDLVLKGDPKQDIRGHACFRELIIENSVNVTYNSVCHRCPISHLNITNSLIPRQEQQLSEKSGGRIEIVFENEICLSEFLSIDFDLKYIYKKNDRIDTHFEKDNLVKFDNLYYEIQTILTTVKQEMDAETIEITAYRFTQLMSRWYKSGKKVSDVLKPFCDYTGRLTNVQYARLCDAFTNYDSPKASKPVVSSIESVKGLEGVKCLFVLTNELAPYLFGKKKTENKTKNALYVALTRSLDVLTILISKEVENDYGKENILHFFEIKNK